MVAGIAANDPVALRAAYDHYAPGLYAYCRSLLSEPAEAADAVHDTFVIAAVRLGGLREPSRLRPWLYAVARNECHRQLASREAATSAPDGTDPGDDTTDFGGPLDQAELRELVQSALAGLSLDDREIVELSMRHAFYGADLADALGVPRNQARALAARGRARLESALGALLVTRSRHGSCAELAQILASWDGELTPAIRKQVARHISGCDWCGERRRRELSPMALLGMLPVPELPPGLRDQVLSLVKDPSPDAAVLRGEVARRAEPFARSGFPVPAGPGGRRRAAPASSSRRPACWSRCSRCPAAVRCCSRTRRPSRDRPRSARWLRWRRRPRRPRRPARPRPGRCAAATRAVPSCARPAPGRHRP